MIDEVRVLRDTIANLASVEHYNHSRWRVYPQDVTATKTLTADAAANIFGSWAEIVPLNTIPFAYDVIGLVLELVSAATTYHIQLGYSVNASDPPANYEAGERRVRMVTVPIAKATELLEITSQNVPANGKLWGRLKTASANTDTCNVSVVLGRHIEVTNPIAKYGAFPW